MGSLRLAGLIGMASLRRFELADLVEIQRERGGTVDCVGFRQPAAPCVALSRGVGNHVDLPEPAPVRGDGAAARYRGTAKLKLFGCRTPSVEAPGVAAYGTSYRLVRNDAQLAGRAFALLSNV